MKDSSLPEKRLGTTDELGARVYIHPQDVKGKWKDRRNIIYWILISIYLVLPWIYYGGKQVILLNIPKREFYMFGTVFYGHDGPILIHLLLGFIFFISFITAIWGRVWCGFACPQTVFIESLFRFVERIVEGSAKRRDRLQAGGWGVEKVIKRTIKWGVFLVLSLHIVHSGLGYFVGTRELLSITFTNPDENLTLFFIMLFLTGVILLDFGWFREQFCIIACPYGRFQSLVMDANSLIVGYDKKRGEPRKRSVGITPSDLGDCVNCDRCVKVCPTGIDIRDGLQMECIACTLCVDACDEIMEKVKKPSGLIKYTSENQLAGKKRELGSFRNFLYAGLTLLMIITLGLNLRMRQDIKIQVLRGSSEAFQVLSKEIVVNHFKLKINFYKHSDLVFDVADVRGPKLNLFEIVIPERPIQLIEGQSEVNLFIKFSKEILINGEKTITLKIYDTKNKETIKELEVRLVGPIK
jgi:cytochrome c oxidase accessory protein FixG